MRDWHREKKEFQTNGVGILVVGDVDAPDREYLLYFPDKEIIGVKNKYEKGWECLTDGVEEKTWWKVNKGWTKIWPCEKTWPLNVCFFLQFTSLQKEIQDHMWYTCDAMWCICDTHVVCMWYPCEITWPLNICCFLQFTSLQKEIEDHKDEIKKLQNEQTKLQGVIKSLEKDIYGLKKEIQERDETIQDKVWSYKSVER